MFKRKTFSEMRRAGMGVGVSKTKLAQAMLDILIQLPAGTTNLKETIGRLETAPPFTIETKNKHQWLLMHTCSHPAPVNRRLAVHRMKPIVLSKQVTNPHYY